METITARFNWTTDDLIQGRKVALKTRKLATFRTIIFGFTLVIIVTTAFLGVPPKPVNHFNPTAAAITFGILLIAVLIAMPLTTRISKFILRRQFAKRLDANMEMVWTITEQGIQTHSPVSKSEIQWTAFQKVIFSPAGFVFMPNSQIFHILPTRAFASPADISALKALAQEHAVEFIEVK